jgi:hypothetical protein
MFQNTKQVLKKVATHKYTKPLVDDMKLTKEKIKDKLTSKSIKMKYFEEGKKKGLRNKKLMIGAGIATGLAVGGSAVHGYHKLKNSINNPKPKKKYISKQEDMDESENWTLSTKQRLFDNKVISYIDNLNESEEIKDDMKNLYYAKKRDAYLQRKQYPEAMIYENLISI